MSRVSVVGTGYVGLVTGACLAEVGHDVVCVDADVARIDSLRAGRVPFHEPGLEELVSAHLGSRLALGTDPAEAVAGTETTFLAVGTPAGPEGAIDLGQVEAAVGQIGRAMGALDRWHVVVVKSTVVPGSTSEVIVPLLEASSGKRAGTGFGVVVNPEFLTEGTAVDDFRYPDRIVLGGTDDRALDQVADLYRTFQGVPVLRTSPGTAEMIKYASNALLATLISFSNQIADLGSAVGGIDVAEVSEGIALSRYLTTGGRRAALAAFLEAGCGFGGSCLPKDLTALTAAGRAAGADTNLLEAVADVNRRRAGRLVEVVARHFPSLRGRSVGVLGLAFKPDTNDVRESPAFPVIRGLLDAGAEVRVHDPVVGPDALPADFAGRVTHQRLLEELIGQVEVLVIVTRWSEYHALPKLLEDVSPPPLVVDGRRMLDRHSVARYDGIGL